MKNISDRYLFIVFSREKLESTNTHEYLVKAKILKLEYNYCYFFKKRVEANRIIENNSQHKTHIDNFSSLGRRLNLNEIINLYNNSKDSILKQQIDELIEARDIVIRTQEKLKLKSVDFAKVFSARPSDVNIWRNMITKPDSFKLETMKYILENKDYQNDPYIKHLISKAHNYYIVYITNLESNKTIDLYTKKFDNKIDALEYFQKLKKDGQFIGLNLKISVVSYFNEAVDSAFTSKKSNKI
ncbi:hypothetical protein [Francisella philomiragia]|uniref:hypothetical protein n=1 Tax=Francisella philomiragia TaxID=28110 RepID=UPI001907E82F|nr:hypothetical protein [Francisella philomiragia]MBK2297332.1 hypothetical protein [Francisella philomiragia]